MLLQEELTLSVPTAGRRYFGLSRNGLPPQPAGTYLQSALVGCSAFQSPHVSAFCKAPKKYRALSLARQHDLKPANPPK
jgi:hypothetical protein